jgi:hypothetical protein
VLLFLTLINLDNTELTTPTTKTWQIHHSAALEARFKAPSAVTKKTVAVFPHQADQNQLAFLMLLSALHKATPLVKVKLCLHLAFVSVDEKASEMTEPRKATKKRKNGDTDSIDESTAGAGPSVKAPQRTIASLVDDGFHSLLFPLSRGGYVFLTLYFPLVLIFSLVLSLSPCLRSCL